MSSIKSKNTSPELLFRKLLRTAGYRGYRLHYPIPGRPDIVFPKQKLAIFIHGCFWHSCPKCQLPNPKSNSLFWQEKLKKNVERDKRKMVELSGKGWETLILWECAIKNNPKKNLLTIKEVLDSKV
jgi:DNA mismatch endonuclease (patch repair protein)